MNSNDSSAQNSMADEPLICHSSGIFRQRHRDVRIVPRVPSDKAYKPQIFLNIGQGIILDNRMGAKKISADNVEVFVPVAYPRARTNEPGDDVVFQAV
ncbi:MAG TPA: hypothetical protein PK869_03275 [Candidatus Hydrogenedentes bacterium]|nr:hypothetical protein [Candidatus Hydrogenedentota bacterium]